MNLIHFPRTALVRSRLAARVSVRIAVLSLIATLLFSNAVGAIDLKDNAANLIRANDNIATLGSDLFGDEVNLYTGALSFQQVDVEIPGNNALRIGIGRRLEIGKQMQLPFGDWDWDIPHLHGVFSKVEGWAQDGAVGSSAYGARCKGFDSPRAVDVWSPDEYWEGTFLYTPDGGDQEVLVRNLSFATAPTDYSDVPTTAYPLITKSFWALRCLDNIDNGPGEGFEAVSPSGTRYRFTWMAKLQTIPLTKLTHSASSRVPSPITSTLLRDEVRLYPTTITDRFGNVVTLKWKPLDPAHPEFEQGQLEWMSSTTNEGGERRLSFTYVGGTSRVSTVSDGDRTWTYHYDPDGASLASIDRPDLSTWTFTLRNLTFAYMTHDSAGCDNAGPLATIGQGTGSGLITHPSGATGTFVVAPVRHGRSNTRYLCDGVPTETQYERHARIFDTLSIQSKTIAGAGLSTASSGTGVNTPKPQVWSYSYGADNGCWVDAPSSPYQCAPGAVSTKTVTVEDPENTQTKYTFSNRFMELEGKLVKVESGGVANVYLSRRDITYAEPLASTFTFADPVGTSKMVRGDIKASERMFPEKTRDETVNGVVMHWEAKAITDPFGAPTIVKRWSSLGFSKTESMAYNNDLDVGVIGQLKTVTNTTASPSVVEQNVIYDPTSALPLQYFSFGNLESTTTYYPSGLVLTRKDGRNKVTTFSDYKRGIPQSIQYHNGSELTGTINNAGWIDTYTDQLGNTTTYDHDSLGRLVLIMQPGVEVASECNSSAEWNCTTISFARLVSGDSYFDQSGALWRQSVITGNQRKDTLFDALWRPIMTKEMDTSSPLTARFSMQGFDSNGRVTFAAYPLPSVTMLSDVTVGTRNEYDALGRLKLVKADAEHDLPTVPGEPPNRVTTKIQYLNDLRKQVTDPNGNVTTTNFMIYDAMTEDMPVRIEAPQGILTVIDRDAYGKPKSITRSGPP